LCGIPIKAWYRVHHAALRRLFFEILQRGKVESRKQKIEFFCLGQGFRLRQGYGGQVGGRDGGQVMKPGNG